MTYIILLDNSIGIFLGNIQLFFLVQIILGSIVLYQSIWQRTHQHSFKSSSLQYGMSRFALKAGQLGLYIHMMLSIISMVDGFQNLTQHTTNPHLFVLSMLFGTCLSKMNVIASIKKKLDKPEDLYI